MCGKWIGTAVSLIFIGKREKPNGNGGVWQGGLASGAMAGLINTFICVSGSHSLNSSL